MHSLHWPLLYKTWMGIESPSCYPLSLFLSFSAFSLCLSIFPLSLYLFFLSVQRINSLVLCKTPLSSLKSLELSSEKNKLHVFKLQMESKLVYSKGRAAQDEECPELSVKDKVFDNRFSVSVSSCVNVQCQKILSLH